MTAARFLTLTFLILLAAGIVPNFRPAAAASVCSNPSCTPITVSLDANSTMTTDITPDPFKGTAPPAFGLPGGVRDAKVKYNDTNSNNQWDPGETVVYDADNSGTYTLGDTVIAGTQPAPASPLKGDPKIRFQDNNNNNLWDTGEPVFWDVNNNFVFDPSDTIIAGASSSGGSFATQAKSFRVGAIINATTTAPVSSVVGWQFAITYNKTLLVPQGDPNPAATPSNPLLYVDGAQNTVLFGTGTPNWAGLIANYQAFGGSNVQDVPGVPTLAKIFVFIAIISPSPAQTITSRQMLASVQFELISKPTTGQVLTLTDVQFVADNRGTTITNIDAGTSAMETITNDPPVARFTATQVFGYVFSFDASASTDGDGTIPSPGSYFWDFGDGTQDYGVTGSLILAHDYSPSGLAPGRLNVTLRVVDNLGATGSARDPLGGVIVNSQPSHTYRTVLANKLPLVRFTYTPTSPTQGTTIAFDASASTDPDGTIASYSWNFGDGGVATGVTTSHVYTSQGTYHVVLTETDNLGGTNSTLEDILVDQPPTLTLTPPSSPTAGQTVTLTLAASDPDGTISSIQVNWGDGKTDSLPGTATGASHVYNTAGTFTITVTVTDNAGRTAVKTSTVTVVASAGLPLTSILLIAIPIIIIAAVAVLLLMRRRTKGAGPPPQTTSPS